MPALTQRWDQIDDANIFLVPLFECFMAICTSIGKDFAPYAVPVFTRAMRVLENFIIHAAAHIDNHTKVDPPDERFAVASLDMISGMCEGLGASVEQLIANSNLIALLVQITGNPNPEVKQAAFALVGDLTRCCPVQIAPVVHQVRNSSSLGFVWILHGTDRLIF